MRFTVIILFIFLGAFVYESSGRPQAVDNESEDDAHYEEDSASEDYLNEKSVDRNSENIENPDAGTSEVQEENADGDANVSLGQVEYENQLEDQPETIKNSRSRQEEESLSDKRQINQNLDRSSAEEGENPELNRHYNTYKRHDKINQIQDEQMNSNEHRILEGDSHLTKDKSEYNNDVLEKQEEPLYKHITYYNKIQGDVFQKRKPNIFLNSNRDRRDLAKENHEKSDSDDKNITNKMDVAENANEDSESAIKRNIKKLSKEELEDLFSSLSDDKKALLKKIIDNKLGSENLNKREITKKAGAVEESNCIDSGPADINKADIRSSNDNVSSLSPSETTETTRHSEGSEVSKSKNSEADNSSTKTDGRDELTNENLRMNQHDSIQASPDRNEETPNISENEMIKNDNKREANAEELTHDKLSMYNQYDSIDNDMNCEKEDNNWSELLKDESDLHTSNNKLYKRGVQDYSNSADIKSLEESFPYYDTLKSKSSESQMSPLIRVKRTNNHIIQRAASNCESMKVPVNSEELNKDLDENEKDEFDDGSIFDKSFNYFKGKSENTCRNKIMSTYKDRKQRSNNYNNFEISSKDRKDEVEAANIGSDTEDILSNAESVEDNLMYNNNKDLRKKRVAVNNSAKEIENNSVSEPEPNMDDGITKNGYMSQYQENDAFGSYPRNSNEEVGRYKRIRRLKQSSEMQGDNAIRK